MNKRIKIAFSIIVLILLTLSTLSLASAMTVSSVDANNFSPGKEQEISIDVKNNLDDAEDVSLSLNLEDLPFTIIEYDDETKDIDSDDRENFDFTIKASNSAKAGDYSIPYTLEYKLEDDTETKNGTFILTIESNAELSYSINAEKPIIGSQGKIKFSIINKGLGDANFVSVKIIPEGYTLLSADNDYVGTIGSDDFETISLDVIFKEKNPVLNAEIEYKDFNNQKVTKSVSLPIKVYSNEEALELGIIKKDNTPMYVGLGIVGFGIIFIVRRIRKKKRQNKTQGR